MDKTYRIIAVHDTKALEEHREQIANLFFLCFGVPLDPGIWAWAYLSNPCGFPYVNLAYADDVLVGHYAIIPLKFIVGNCRHSVALSMTTMVHPSHRKSGLFSELANATYRQAVVDGTAAVFGFPNNNSAPGFRKRLNWEIDEKWGIVAVPVSLRIGQRVEPKLVSSDEFRALFKAPTEAAFLDLSDPELLTWRLAKPGTQYTLLRVEKELFIVKPYGDSLDLVYHSSVEQNILSAVSIYANSYEYKTINIFGCLSDGADQKTSYRFGFRCFDTALTFKPQLIFSDVF